MCSKHIVQDDEDVSTAPGYDLYYYDHILMCDTTQDSGAVMSIFEALMWRIKQQHPRIKEVFVQSDNASAYQCNALLYCFDKVTAQFGIKLVSRLHPDTQMGKDLVDAR